MSIGIESTLFAHGLIAAGLLFIILLLLYLKAKSDSGEGV